MGDTIWSAFWRIEMSRQTPFEGAQPFTYQEIEAFIRLSRQPLSPWQVETIMEMDIHRRNALNETRNAATGVPGARATVSANDPRAFERMLDSFGDVVDVEP